MAEKKPAGRGVKNGCHGRHSVFDQRDRQAEFRQARTNERVPSIGSTIRHAFSEVAMGPLSSASRPQEGCRRGSGELRFTKPGPAEVTGD